MNSFRASYKSQGIRPQNPYFSNLSCGVCLQNICDYSPFGVSLDGRTMESEFYRRGFNGMEKDDEWKGKGDCYDFGARMFNSRIGRFLSKDPLEKKYAFISPYVFCNNSPISCVDIKGEDYRYNIYKDRNGEWHLDITSTVHVFTDREDVDRRVVEYNAFMRNNAQKFAGITRLQDGTNVHVSINIKFVEGQMNSANNKVLNFEKGDNLLYLRRNVQRGETMGAFGNSVENMKVGFKVVMRSGDSYYSRATTVVHDIMHQLGLGDRYHDPRNGSRVEAHAGFETDLLGLGPQTDYQGNGFTFSQEHFANYAKVLFKKEVIHGVSKKRVDNHSIDEMP
jgi:RHS repeat-associated protein